MSVLDDPTVQAEIAQARADRLTWRDIAEFLRIDHGLVTTPEGLRAALRRRNLVSGGSTGPRSVVRPETSSRCVARERRCLNCQRGFQSAWAGERICGNCRRSEKFQGLGAAYV